MFPGRKENRKKLVKGYTLTAVRYIKFEDLRHNMVTVVDNYCIIEVFKIIKLK